MSNVGAPQPQGWKAKLQAKFAELKAKWNARKSGK